MKGFVSKLISKANRATRQVKRILANPARLQNRLQPPKPAVHTLERPWHRVRSDTAPEAVYVLARRNYKVHANIGETVRHTTRFVVVLDTGAASSFINLRDIPVDVRKRIMPPSSSTNVRNASGSSVPIAGTIDLVVQVGESIEHVNFLVAKKLATSVILGCDFCDRHVESIRPRDRTVVMDDGSTVPIIRKSSASVGDDTKGTVEEELAPAAPRCSPRIRVTKRVKLQPDTQTWVEVVTKRQGLILVEPVERLYNDRTCLTAAGVADVRSNEPFKLLVANFGPKAVDLKPNQVVAMAETHPENLVESHISHAEMLGLIPDDPIPGTSKYRKFNFNTRDENLINRQLADEREKHMGADEKHMTADDIELDIPVEKEKDVRDMLRKHEKIWNGELGAINVTDMRIDLVPDAKPFKSAPYRAGPKTRELEQAEVDKQLKAGVIEPAMSEWAAPVLFAPKKDGKLRFCIDYRKLNSMTVKDTYPLPRMDECIDSLGESEYFTTLDAFAGYWQINLRKRDRHKTAFVCHAGTYQYKRMPFGLTNAPACFQRALDMILTKYKWKTCLVYIDDVVIYSKNVDDHIKHVDEILRTLAHAGVTLKIKKCHFFQKCVEYLGHMVKPNRLEVDQANVESLRQAKPPTTKTQLRSFLGLCNVYRRFIEKYAMIAHPLNSLLKKGTSNSFTLDEEQFKAFENLVDKVCTPPVLSLPAKNLPYSVDTDASAYGIGCALFQTHPDGTRKPIGYWSRSLNDAERNYSAAERECLAVVWALRTLRPYLMYEKFVVHTDHAALHWLLTINDPSGRLMRWRLRLAEFDFEVKYKKGLLNTQADALSRLTTTAETILDDEDDIPAFMSDMLNSELEHDKKDGHEHEFMDVQYKEVDELFSTLDEPAPADSTFQPISIEELLKAQLTDAFSVDVRRRLNKAEVNAFDLDDNGILVRTSDKGNQIVAPQSLKDRILHINHYPKLAGHPGGRKMYYKIRKDFYWPALAVDCYATVRRCPHCARNRIKLRRNATELQLFPATAPLTSVCIDVLGEFIKTKRGHEYLLVITDRFTKMTKTVPMKGISAAEVAKHFVNSWVFNYGPPEELISDNGGCFTAKYFQDVCKLLNVKNSYTKTYHPQTNGQVERYNRTVLAALRTYVADHPRDWDLYTDALAYAYNCQPHTSTSMAPFELVLSKAPGPLALEPMPSKASTRQDFKRQWKHWLRDTLSTTKQRLDVAQARYKRNYDRRLRRQAEKIQVDDHVFLRVERKNLHDHRHKLAAVAEGPFRVKEAKDDTVVIEKPDRTVERVSRSRVVLAPKPATVREVDAILRPIPNAELDKDYPKSEEENRLDLTTPVPSKGPNKPVTPVLKETPKTPTPEVVEENEVPTEEFVIDDIISHMVNKSRRHQYANKGETLYRVRWYGFEADDDTWEPIKHLPRSKVLSYFRRKDLEIPEDIDKAING